MKSVAVVTATTGRPSLYQAVASVQKQTHACNHYVIWDGVEPHRDFQADVFANDTDLSGFCLYDLELPKPTGGNGMMNGCILAMAAYICTEDYLCFLDDDNWMEPNHVETLVKALEEKDAAYSYALRNLVNPDGSFYAQDNGESTGHAGAQFVDANCYLFKRDLLLGIAPLWVKTNGEMNVSDRYVWAAFQENKIPWAATGLYTLNYRMSSRGKDMKPFFFLKNITTRSKYPDGFPWAQSA